MNKTEKANKLIKNGLLAIGAFEVEGDHYPLKLETKAGLLAFSLSDTDGKSKVWSCFSKFGEPSRAVEIGLLSNPYSGKWNWHYFHDEMDENQFAEKILSDVKKVI